jgi:recombination protein RecT
MTQVATTKENSIKTLLQRDDVKNRFAEMLGKKANGFLTSVMSAVQANQQLSKADPTSIMFAAAAAASLDLPIQPNLGFAYLVPYNTKQNDGSTVQMCQFQIGYKGFIQLCQRTGQFKTINAVPVYEGQIVSENPLHGNTYDWNVKSDTVIGYVAFFELVNGFTRELYMSKSQIAKHAGRYSKTYKNQYGVWKTNEDEMSIKTVLKLLLSRYAPMSIDFIQKAVVVDQGVLSDWDGESVNYPDNAPAQIDYDALREQLVELFAEREEHLPHDDAEDIARIIRDNETASYQKAITLIELKTTAQ